MGPRPVRGPTPAPAAEAGAADSALFQALVRVTHLRVPLCRGKQPQSLPSIPTGLSQSPPPQRLIAHRIGSSNPILQIRDPNRNRPRPMNPVGKKRSRILPLDRAKRRNRGNLLLGSTQTRSRELRDILLQEQPHGGVLQQRSPILVVKIGKRVTDRDQPQGQMP